MLTIRRVRALRESANVVGSGSLSVGIIRFPEDSSTPDTTRTTASPSVSSATESSNLYPQPDSSSSTQTHTPGCLKCGSVGLRKPPDIQGLYCPACNIYQPL